MTDEQEKKEEQSSEPQQKRRYRRPQLRILGSLADLTQGGVTESGETLNS